MDKPTQSKQATIDNVPVNEADCRKRTGDILTAIGDLDKKLTVHIAVHKEGERAKSAGWSRIGSLSKLIAVILTGLSLIGLLIWNTSQTVKAVEIATEAIEKVENGY